MNVLLSAWLARLFHGGVEKRLHDIGNGLVEADHNVTMLCAKTPFAAPYPHPKKFSELNFFIPFSPYGFNRTYKNNVEVLAMLSGKRTLRRHGEKFDICHARGLNDWPAIQCGVPTVVDMTGRWLGWNSIPGHLGQLMLACIEKANHIIAVSNLARNNMVAAGIDSRRISVIYSGVPVERIRTGNKYRALSNFGLNAEKNI